MINHIILTLQHFNKLQMCYKLVEYKRKKSDLVPSSRQFPQDNIKNLKGFLWCIGLPTLQKES